MDFFSSHFKCSNIKLRINFEAFIRPRHAERHQNIKADLMYRLVIKISANGHVHMYMGHISLYILLYILYIQFRSFEIIVNKP